ncbi:hypothetical protein QVD17_27599 [Tagetes erecta]|uniref:Uncharacterized protein n=1 Tax=Tagetes erecta TaxID=13708 RepID=A0AAD8K9C8_TARER|nr:hypothetical protein QVD17_27599 [Tagetes erecta]
MRGGVLHVCALLMQSVKRLLIVGGNNDVLFRLYTPQTTSDPTLKLQTMLRRKPSKIEVKIEDKEEIEEARKRTTTTTTTTTGATSLLHHFNNTSSSSSKAQRIGLQS